MYYECNINTETVMTFSPFLNLLLLSRQKLDRRSSGPLESDEKILQFD